MMSNKNMPEQKFINQMEPWYDSREIRAVNTYLKKNGWIMEYEKTRKLEEIITDYTGARYCSILPNGTLTLWATMFVLGIEPNEEVIVPDYTMIATANAVKLAGAKPVLVDIDRKNLCLDLELTKAAITKKTRAIILVSMNGRCPQVQEFVALAKKYNLYLIEDAAQSLGCKFKNKHLGTFGIFGSFSFSMPKIITMGQGGALITNNREKYEKLLKFKDFGREKGGGDDYKLLGCNLKFTDLQAVFGIEQMKKLDRRVKRKKEIYQLYDNQLKNISAIELIPTNLADTTPWFIDILVPDPDKLAEFLAKNNIGTRRVYPAIHKLPFYNIKGKFPIANEVTRRGLWLPSASCLTNREINYICKKIKQFFA